MVCLLSGRCYCQFVMILLWLMVSHWGRCYTSLLNIGRSCSLVADGMVTFYPYAMAHVITIVIVDRWYIYSCGRCCCLFCTILRQMVGHWSRCYGLFCWAMADVIAIWQNGIATFRVDLFQFKFWDVKQNLIPHVRQMVFAYVVEGWTVHPYVYCFFDSSDQILVLPPHYILKFSMVVQWPVKMVINWGFMTILTSMVIAQWPVKMVINWGLMTILTSLVRPFHLPQDYKICQYLTMRYNICLSGLPSATIISLQIGNNICQLSRHTICRQS